MACSGSSITIEDLDSGPAPSTDQPPVTDPNDDPAPPALDPGHGGGGPAPADPHGDPHAPDASVSDDAGDAGSPRDAAADAAPATCEGTAEIEPNNAAGTATVFTTAFCGALPTAADVDYFKMTLPATAKRIRATYTSTGLVDVRVIVRGQTIALGGTGPGAGAIPFFANETYVFQASSPSKKAQSYALTVRFD
jgi:hypothetical protein